MARRIPRDQSLSRVQGVGALFSAAYGNVGSSIYYALGVTAAFALGLTPVAFVIAGLIFMFTAASYTEATVMYPEAGGSSSFARHAFNELVSFIAGWGQMLNYVITVAISAFFVPHYLAVFWHPLHHAPGDVIGGIVLIAALAALNIKGSQESAKLNLILAIADLCTQIVLVAIGIVLVLSPSTLIDNVHLGVAPSWGHFALGIAVGMIAYTGIETISNMAEEAKDAPRTIPRGVGLVVLAVLGLYLLIPLVALSAMPVHHLANGHYTTALGSKFAGDPILGIVENLGLSHGLTQAMRYYVGVLAAVILLIATNAGLIGVSRLTYSMGQHRQLPERLRQLHPRFRTPYIAILVFGLVAALTIVPGKAKFLGTVYAFGAMLSFTIAHLAVIALRVKHPDRERPYTGPGTLRVAGRELPAFALFGVFGTGIAWIVVTVLNVTTLIAGTAWLAIGIATYVLYRRRQGLTLTQTAKVVLPKPVVEHEVEYESILVAFEDDDYSPDAVSTAAKLAASRRRGIHVLVTITVPASAPIDASMPQQEQKAQEIVDSARVRGGRRVTGHWEKVRPGEAGRRVVDEARDIRARAIVMPLQRRSGAPVFNRTLETVLAERPCRVIMEAPPGPRARAAAV